MREFDFDFFLEIVENYFAEATGVAKVNSANAVVFHEAHALGARLGIHVASLRIDATDVDDQVLVQVVLVYVLDGADFGVDFVTVVSASDDRASAVDGNGPVSKSSVV